MLYLAIADITKNGQVNSVDTVGIHSHLETLFVNRLPQILCYNITPQNHLNYTIILEFTQKRGFSPPQMVENECYGLLFETYNSKYRHTCYFELVTHL